HPTAIVHHAKSALDAGAPSTHDPKPKFISLTWRLRSGPTKRTRGNLEYGAAAASGKDDKYELAQGLSLRNPARIGSSNSKLELFPSVDSTQMRPPCISTICLAMASPRPVPPLALVREPST